MSMTDLEKAMAAIGGRGELGAIPVRIDEHLCPGDIYIVLVEDPMPLFRGMKDKPKPMMYAGSREVVEFLIDWINRNPEVKTSPPCYFMDGELVETAEAMKRFDDERRRRFKCFTPGAPSGNRDDLC